MAQTCASLMTSSNVTLEKLSSNVLDPTYFHPLSLPPASPNWIWPADGDLKVAAVEQARALYVLLLVGQAVILKEADDTAGSPPPQPLQPGHFHPQPQAPPSHHPHAYQDPHTHFGSPSELGSQAQISYRTAKRYGVDRGVWTKPARHRWG